MTLTVNNPGLVLQAGLINYGDCTFASRGERSGTGDWSGGMSDGFQNQYSSAQTLQFCSCSISAIFSGMLLNNTGTLVVLAAIGLSFVLVAAAQLTQQNADRFQRKIDEIAKNAAIEPVRQKQTTVTHDEVNSYLAFEGKEKIPHGLSNPEINLLGSNRVSGRALVDIDEFKRHRGSQGFLDPFHYLSGRVPVTARGFVHAREGRGQFRLESAEIHGVPLPNQIVQELVSFFSRTPENPQGFRMDGPFDLPAKIREVVIKPGEATIVQ